MADKRCDNGHFIDESWDLCPYCPVEASAGDVPVVRPSRFNHVEGRPEPRPEPRVVEPRPEPRPVPQAPEPRRPTAVPPPAPPPPRREPMPSDPPPMDRTVAVQKVDLNTLAKRYVVGWLVGLTGPARGESYPIRIGRNVLGRDKRSDVAVNDDQASSHHADLVFRPEERRFILMDHNSTNGTYVNEMEIEPRRDLVARDVVRIGAHQFLFIPLCDESFYWDEEGALK